MVRRTVLAAWAVIGLVAPATAGAVDASTAVDASVAGWPEWAAVLLAGDASITAFDNGVDALDTAFTARGVNVVSTLKASLGTATRAGLMAATLQLRATDAAGCLVYLTSHGSVEGLYLSLEWDSSLRPAELDALLDAGCGDRPTAVVISACHSGTFVSALSAPNRVIITAARTERSSFGCSADAVYTFFDGCVLHALPAADAWDELYGNALSCVRDREGELGYQPSEPQFSAGAEMAGAALPVPFSTWLKRGQTAVAA